MVGGTAHDERGGWDVEVYETGMGSGGEADVVCICGGWRTWWVSLKDDDYVIVFDHKANATTQM